MQVLTMARVTLPPSRYVSSAGSGGSGSGSIGDHADAAAAAADADALLESALDTALFEYHSGTLDDAQLSALDTALGVALAAQRVPGGTLRALTDDAAWLPAAPQLAIVGDVKGHGQAAAGYDEYEEFEGDDAYEGPDYDYYNGEGGDGPDAHADGLDGHDVAEPHGLAGAQRAAALREACRRELGVATFERVYAYLRRRDEEGVEAEGEDDDERCDERMRSELLSILGESKLRLWPLVDQLVFLDECG